MEWIKQKWKDLSIEIIGGLILLGLTIGAGRWAAAIKLAGPWIILLVIGIVALGLLAINQFHIIRERNKKSFASQSNKQIEATLREWVYSRGYTISKASTGGAALFAFEARMGDRPVTVARLQNEQRFIKVLGALNVAQDLQDNMQKLHEDRRRIIMGALRIEMARLGLNYEGIGDPLTRIGVHRDLYCDHTLTETVFVDAVWHIVRGLVLLRQVLYQEVTIASIVHTEESQT